MVEGAVLPHGDPHGDTRSNPPRAPCAVVVADVARNSVEDLARWLRTRGLQKPTGASKPALVESVCDHLKNEKQSIEEGEVVFIRDPDGGSCTVTCSDAEKLSCNSMGGTQRHRRWLPGGRQI